MPSNTAINCINKCRVSTLLAIFQVVILSTACSRGVFSGDQKGNLSIKKTVISENEISSRELVNSVDTLDKLSFEQISKVTMSDFYSKSLEQSSNEPMTVFGHTISNRRDFLIQNEDFFRKMADRYHTIGDYFDLINFTDAADLNEDVVANGYSVLANSLDAQNDNLYEPNNAGISANQSDGLFLLLQDSNDSTLMAAAAPGSNASNSAAKNLADDNHKPNTCREDGGMRCGCAIAGLYHLDRCVPAGSDCNQWCENHYHWNDASCEIDAKGNTPNGTSFCTAGRPS